MIDLHNHILYGIDDGARTIEEALEMIDQAIKIGVTTICATSHYKSGSYENKNYEKNYKKLIAKVKEESIDIKILRGNELMLDIEGLEALKAGKVNTINDTKYLLVEPFPGMNALALEKGLKRIVELGYLPILAHVERYTHLRIEQLARIKKLGIIYQVNIESIMNFRERIEALIEEDLVDIVASDAHRKDKRSYKLEESIDRWKKLIGEESWELMSTSRPITIIEGEKDLKYNEKVDNRGKNSNTLVDFIYRLSSLWKGDRPR